MTIESTSRVVYIETPRGNGSVPARVWEGQTEEGVPVAVLVTRVAAHRDADQSEFQAGLSETQAPSSHAVEAFPLRLVL